VTRVESFCEKRDSSRVTIFLNVTQVESESPKIVTRVTPSLPWSPKFIDSTMCPLFCHFYKKVVLQFNEHDDVNATQTIKIFEQTRSLPTPFLVAFLLMRQVID